MFVHLSNKNNFEVSQRRFSAMTYFNSHDTLWTTVLRDIQNYTTCSIWWEFFSLILNWKFVETILFEGVENMRMWDVEASNHISMFQPMAESIKYSCWILKGINSNKN